MVGNKQTNAGGTGPDSLSGRVESDDDTGASQQKAQDGSSTSGHYTGAAGAGTERDGGIVSAPPESNVGPPGAAQSSRGSAEEPVQANTDNAGKPGGGTP